MENVLRRHITDLQNICLTSYKNIKGNIFYRSQTWQYRPTTANGMSRI